MSRLGTVMKKKGDITRKMRSERQMEISDLKSLSMYTAKLHEELKKSVDTLLEDDRVEHVSIVIPPKLLSLFMKAMYREEFFIYNIVQVPGAENEFEISRKEIII